MNCLGCYKGNVQGYCLKCRKQLFEGKQVPSILSFKAPQNENIQLYQEQTKRLSISGVQLKYSLRLEGKQLQLTDRGGQFILKPIPPSIIAYPDQAPENEHLTMQIAEQVFKIDTAKNALIYFEDGQAAYITRRFDIKADGSKCLQEDFAQLSMRSKKTHGNDFKYSGTYEDIGLLIRKYVAAYPPALEIFFKNVVFNYLLSNGDAHLKNFSLIQTDIGDYSLTPSYDLMSTIVHTPNEQDTALDLFEGDIDTDFYKSYGYYGYPHFMELAKRISMLENRARRIITYMTSQSDKVTRIVGNSLLSDPIKSQYLSNYQDKVRRMSVPSE